jgi:hypothetical protein
MGNLICASGFVGWAALLSSSGVTMTVCTGLANGACILRAFAQGKRSLDAAAHAR